MRVVLYKVGRNLNRAYRTAEAFGVSDIVLVECSGKLGGNLFGARGRVGVYNEGCLPTSGTLALETFYKNTLDSVDWSAVDSIVVGGESSGLPRSIEFEQQAKIPMFGKISGLTVEAALAIALYEWRQNDTLVRD